MIWGYRRIDQATHANPDNAVNVGIMTNNELPSIVVPLRLYSILDYGLGASIRAPDVYWDLSYPRKTQ